MVMENNACQITLESTSETLINLPDSMINILIHILNIHWHLEQKHYRVHAQNNLFSKGLSVEAQGNLSLLRTEETKMNAECKFIF